MFSEETAQFCKIVLSTTILSLRELFRRIKTPSRIENVKAGHSKENQKGTLRRYDVEFGLPSGIDELKIYTGELLVWAPQEGNSTFYDITNIKFSRKVRDTATAADSTAPHLEDGESPHNLPANISTISQTSENTNNSESNDKIQFSVDAENLVPVAALLKNAREAWNNNRYNFSFRFALSAHLKPRFEALLEHKVKIVLIDAGTVRHIKNNHSGEAEIQRGQKLQTADDILLIPYSLIILMMYN